MKVTLPLGFLAWTLTITAATTSPRSVSNGTVTAPISTTTQSSSLCLTTSTIGSNSTNGTTSYSTTVLRGACPVTQTPLTQPTYAVYTPAPWLSNLPQTTVVHIETFAVAQSTAYRTFTFVVPAPTNIAAVSPGVAGCPATSTVTVSITSCPTSSPAGVGAATNNAAVQTNAQAVAATNQNVAVQQAQTLINTQKGTAVSTQTRTILSWYVSTATSLSTLTRSTTLTKYTTITGVAGAVTTSSTTVVSAVITHTVLKPTTVTVTVTTTYLQTGTTAVLQTTTAVLPANTTPQAQAQTSTTARTIPDGTNPTFYSNTTYSKIPSNVESSSANNIVVISDPATATGSVLMTSSTNTNSITSPTPVAFPGPDVSGSIPVTTSTSPSSTPLYFSLSGTPGYSMQAISLTTTTPTSEASFVPSYSSSPALSFQPTSADFSSIATSSNSPSLFSAIPTSSSFAYSFIPTASTSSSQTTSAVIFSPLSSSATPISSSSSSSAMPMALPSSSSSSSSSSSACPIGTLAPSATAPAPAAGTNVYSIAGNAPYSLSESQLLAAISFPKGFNCNKKLVILMPGTAVPAPDTFSNTFIPAFENAATEAEAGNVDILMVSVPTISLGPAWQTAEYIAYAMDYANLVLKRPGTIIAWSQGNLNVQWAFKYWPSTRTNVPGRNYVAMSADYDGTILGSFLCQPISILTSGSGATLAEQFIANNGLGVLLASLGLSALPTSSTGVTDPEAFRAILLNLVYGTAATQGLGGGVVGASSASTSSLTLPTTTALGVSAIITQLPVGKRAVEFGNKREVVNMLRERVNKRQSNLLSDGVTLIGGISDPVLTELATIIVDPTAPLAQIFANLAKLAVDPSNLSIVPTGCAPAVWDQGYGSNFVTRLAQNGGDLAYVPTTSVFSLTDEVVQPMGITGKTAASAYMDGSNSGVVAPENIFIQEHCDVINNLLLVDAPPLITHEGVLASGMGVAAAILAVISQSTVSYADIVAAYGASEACALISQRLTVADYLGNEATIPGALLRVTVGPGTTDPSAQYVAEEPALPAYATF